MLPPFTQRKPAPNFQAYPPYANISNRNNHREANFPTLILTILEQQVSLASAKATYDRLIKMVGILSPKNFLKLSIEELKACTFSRQKIRYTRILAEEIVENRLDLDSLNQMDEPEIRHRLTQLTGIGDWTADMYVLMSLHFTDIFPPGDLATIKAVFELNLVETNATKEEIIEYMKKFSPHRSVATYILWHYYIEKRNLVLE